MLCRLLFAILLLFPLTMTAQEAGDNVAVRAERVFSFLMQDQADSLYCCFAPVLQQKLKKEQLSGAMRQAEQLAGAYRQHGEWECTRHDSLTICSSICTFENGQLNVVMAFDGNFCLHGLQLMPLADNGEEDVLPDGVAELADTVHTDDGLALPCVITLSGLSAEPPVVVMVHGSGPLDRDETVMANKPFRDLARLLAQRGISTLRYDKRTFVSHEPVTSMEKETIVDALAALALARTYNNNVYLLGHSLGAMLAPAIATKTDLQGVVMMAAPARDLEQVVSDQLDYLAAPGSTKEMKQQAMEELRTQTPHYFQPQQQVKTALRLKTPLLLLQGERDYQVPMTEFRIWQKKLRKKQHVTFKSYPALNHLFIEGDGPSTPQEYMKKGCVSEQVADDIATFIKATSIKQ